MPHRAPPAPPSPGRLALTVALVYAAFASAWIAYSDQLLAIWFHDPDVLTRMQTWKGMIYVLITALLLWWLARGRFVQQARLRERLAQQERDWRTVFHENPQSMWVCERGGGRMLAANDAALRRYGYTRPEFMALTPRELERADAAPLADGVRRHFRHDGAAMQVEVLMRDTEFGGVPASLVLVRDAHPADAEPTPQAGVVSVQEAERRRLARELHDEIGQVLTGLAFNLHALAREPLSDAASGRLADSRALVERALVGVRDCAFDLHPAILAAEGLGPAVAGYCRRQAARAGVEIAVEGADSIARLPEGLETAAFRIVQEAVGNSLRHGAPLHVTVRMAARGGRLELGVEDDGRGFDMEAPRAARSGLGLIGMRERAALAGGILEIDSRPGAGTRVRASVPLD